MSESDSWAPSRLEGVPSVLAEVVKMALARDADPKRASLALLHDSLVDESSRDGAWPLLGADALITYLSADALDGEEPPEVRLGELFRLYLGGA